MITASITIDLTQQPDYDRPTLERHQLVVLERVPDNGRVVIDLGDRAWVTDDAALMVHRHADRLRIEVTGKRPDVVDRFVRAATAGSLAVAV